VFLGKTLYSHVTHTILYLSPPRCTVSAGTDEFNVVAGGGGGGKPYGGWAFGGGGGGESL